MVMIDYNTAKPLIMGDQEYDSSAPTADEVVQLFLHTKITLKYFILNAMKRMNFILVKDQYQYQTICQLIQLDLQLHTQL